MKPYYQDDYATIYHGDCRELLPELPKVDLVLTDPPYGIGAAKMNLGKWRTSKMPKQDWDALPVDGCLMRDVVNAGTYACIWGGNYYMLEPSRCFLVWDKGAGFKGRDFSECEQAWCSWDAVARIKQYDPLARGDYKHKQHPTQKPLDVILWAIGLCPNEPQTILDPFMGSGTTLRAAKDLQRKCIGIELEEKYCEIAAKRMAQEVLPFP